MKLKLEYLAGCGTFSECRFRTPFYEKEVSGLAFICRSGPAVWEPQSLLLVCGGLIPSGREPLALWLDERKGRGAAGFLADLSGRKRSGLMRWQRHAASGNWSSGLWQRNVLHR